jgi:hypothetical protein
MKTVSVIGLTAEAGMIQLMFTDVLNRNLSNNTFSKASIPSIK